MLEHKVEDEDEGERREKKKFNKFSIVKVEL